jgi:O-antigen ligase
MSSINWFKASKFFIVLSALFVAIVVSTSLFPFIVGKYVWFRSCVSIALITFLLGLAFHGAGEHFIVRLKGTVRSPVAIATLLFTLVFLLACFFGVDPALSFWSNFERGEGGIQVLHLAVFFLLLSVLFETKEDWLRLFRWVLCGGLLMAAYGLFAGLGVGGFIGVTFSVPSFRFAGSIGNAAYVAAFSIFALFYIAYLFVSRWRAKRLFSPGNIVLSFLGIVFLLTFYFASTRGAFLGLVAAVVAFLAYFAYSHAAWRRWLIIGGILLVAAVVALIQFQDTAFVKNLPGSRIFDISFGAETFRHRSIMWNIAVDGWKERPLLGWGPENYIQVFDRHFDTRYFVPGEQFGAWFDRAHSVIFDYLVETGALGLLVYLGMFIVFYWQFFATKKDRVGRTATFSESWLFAFPVAYLVQGLILFDVLPISYNLFLFLAFATVYLSGFTANAGGADGRTPRPRS